MGVGFSALRSTLGEFHITSMICVHTPSDTCTALATTREPVNIAVRVWCRLFQLNYLSIATLELRSAVNLHFRVLLCASCSHGALMSISEHVLYKIALVKRVLQREAAETGIGSGGAEGEVVVDDLIG